MLLKQGLALWLLALAAPAGAEERFDVIDYAVSLAPDLATGAVSGSETVRLVSEADGLSELRFSGNALRIEQASVDGVSVAVEQDKEAIRFRLGRPLRAGQSVRLRFTFSGMPARGVKRAPRAIFTSYFACDWMVCRQDTPGDKARLALDLVLPEGKRSLGVGRMAGTKRLGGGRVAHRWRSERAFSSYLYAFAAGELSETRRGRLSFLDATGEGGDLSGRLAETAAMADFFAGKAGVPLPGGTYAQLLVPEREAQEAATFALIGRGELEAEKGDPANGWVIAHELAHLWWGNGVTSESWQHFWLNEGMAVFMTAAWKEHRFGAAAYAEEIGRARARAERAKARGQDRPLAWSGKHDSLGARRDIQYGKGALFLDHLRHTLGEAAFWKGLRLYTRRHWDGSVTSRDLQRAMEDASGRDLGALFGEWVYGPAA